MLHSLRTENRKYEEIQLLSLLTITKSEVILNRQSTEHLVTISIHHMVFPLIESQWGGRKKQSWGEKEVVVDTVIKDKIQILIHILPFPDIVNLGR